MAESTAKVPYWAEFNLCSICSITREPTTTTESLTIIHQFIDKIKLCHSININKLFPLNTHSVTYTDSRINPSQQLIDILTLPCF